MRIIEYIVKLLEDPVVRSSLTLLLTTLCGVGVTWLNIKRNQLMDMAEGTKRSSLRSEYLQIYNSKEFTTEEKWDMTRDIVDEYFNKLNGNHYIHSLDSKLKMKLEGESNG